MNAAAFQIGRGARRWLVGLMLLAALVAWAARPTLLLAEQRPRVDLQTLLPQTFGAWTHLPGAGLQLVNPQQQQVLERLYSQTLSRVYGDAAGNRVMLSVAYGVRQTDDFALHYPESCYPAQGFQVLGTERGQVDTAFGPIAVTRLRTRLGARHEPVTYWATLGNAVVYRGLDTRVSQLRHGMRGEIPDGLVLRFSTLHADARQGHAVQDAFAAQLVAALAPENRQFLSGL